MGREDSAIVRAAFVSTYPPRHCGTAAFTFDLAAAYGPREVVALHAPDEARSAYPVDVRHRIRKHDRADHVRMARALNERVDVVSIQHADGIWGGDDGEYVLDFVRALDVPSIATLHSVSQQATGAQRAVLSELVSRSARTVVMSHAAANVLKSTYGADPGRLEVIPHGVPNLPFVDPATIKPSVGVDGHEVILSFGFLGPGKGYELAIAALPEVVKAHPTALYVIVGATDADLLLREGEAYRQTLVATVAKLGLERHVRFVDRFVGRVELTRWLEAADAFVTPYPALDKSASGALSYAMAAGRAVVSTPFSYASELLAEGRGVVVPSASPRAIATGLKTVLGDRELRDAVGRRAYDYTRRMVWSAVAGEYRALFGQVAAPSRPVTDVPIAASVRA